MKILDCKDYCNKCDKSLTEKKYRELDKRLQHCSSFAKQKELLISFYAEEAFKRDELLSRQFSLERKVAFDANERVSWSKETFIAFIAAIFTVCIEKACDADPKEPIVGTGLLVLFIMAVVANLIHSVISAKKQDAKERIPTYEIMCLEKAMIEKGCKLTLLNENQEIDVRDLIETILHTSDNL